MKIIVNLLNRSAKRKCYCHRGSSLMESLSYLLVVLRLLLFLISTQIHRRLLHTQRPFHPLIQQIHHQHWLNQAHLLLNLILMYHPVINEQKIENENKGKLSHNYISDNSLIIRRFFIVKWKRKKNIIYPTRTATTFLLPPTWLQNVQFSFFL